MDFLDKFNEMTKMVGDKTNELAKKVGDKAEDAIETGKLSAKISKERFAVQEDLKKIGEYYYIRFLAGDEIAPEVLGYCNSAKAHYDTIADAQAEMRQLKKESKAAEETEVIDEEDVTVE